MDFLSLGDSLKKRKKFLCMSLGGFGILFLFITVPPTPQKYLVTCQMYICLRNSDIPLLVWFLATRILFYPLQLSILLNRQLDHIFAITIYSRYQSRNNCFLCIWWVRLSYILVSFSMIFPHSDFVSCC